MVFTRRQIIVSAAAAVAVCSSPTVFAANKSVKIAVGGNPNSRPTRSLTIEVAREFFYSQQIQQVTVSFGHGTNDESVCRTVLSCLYTA